MKDTCLPHPSRAAWVLAAKNLRRPIAQCARRKLSHPDEVHRVMFEPRTPFVRASYDVLTIRVEYGQCLCIVILGTRSTTRRLFRS